MLATLLLGATLLTTTPDVARPSARDRETYEEILAKIPARDADAHVKLALWCERHGLSAERVKHLALAVLANPRHAAARGLMGLVDFRGGWTSPEAVADKIKADEALAGALSEYNARRADLRETADDHLKLALWCEENGLAPEARAHFTAVVRLDPTRESAWKKLGLRRVKGRLVSDEQLALEKAEVEAQREANRNWRPQIIKWRSALRSRDAAVADEARARLDAIDDFRAVPSIWAVFAVGQYADHETAVRILGHVDGPASTRALAVLGVHSDSPESRRAASEILKRRDGRDFIGLLISLIGEPTLYEVRPVAGSNLPGELFVEGEQSILRRVYLSQEGLNQSLSLIPPRIFDDSVPFNPDGLLLADALAVGTAGNRSPIPSANESALRRDAMIAQRIAQHQVRLAQAQQRIAADVATIEANNARIHALNERTLPVLVAVAGQDLGDKTENWKAWWADQQGYVYERSSTTTIKPVVTQVLEEISQPRLHSACFAAGTPVRALEGLKPIETLQVGDRVLSQDITTGRMTYEPVLAPIRNKPSETFRVKVGDDEVVATGIHRFWKAGHGWVMTRDLKPGDVLRTVGGLATVATVTAERVQPVFNLEVGETRTYFVGESSLLVHDNRVVHPVARPFDAPVSAADIVAVAE